MCTNTADTTSSAAACPSDRYQNVGVRSASRAVKSRRAGTVSWRDPSAATESSSGFLPSIWSPNCAGWWRTIKVSGKPTTRTMTPEANAVVRQPKLSRDHTTAGTMSPPTAMPVNMIPRASARLRSKQFTTETVNAMNPGEAGSDRDEEEREEER